MAGDGGRLGRFLETPVAGEIVRALVPPPLPPLPPLDVLSLLDRLSRAERALGRLDGITMLLPRQELFLYMYVRKEPGSRPKSRARRRPSRTSSGSRPRPRPAIRSTTSVRYRTTSMR